MSCHCGPDVCPLQGGSQTSPMAPQGNAWHHVPATQALVPHLHSSCSSCHSPFAQLFPQLRTHFPCSVPDLSSRATFSGRLSLTSPTGLTSLTKPPGPSPHALCVCQPAEPLFLSQPYVGARDKCPASPSLRPPRAMAHLSTWASPGLSSGPSIDRPPAKV